MALTFRRTVGERIMIGDNVTLTVTGIAPRTVELEFEADDNVSIDREEIRLKKLLGQMEDKPVCSFPGKKKIELDAKGIATHLSEVFDLHMKNKNYDESIRFLKLLPGMNLLSEEYLIAILDASFVDD